MEWYRDRVEIFNDLAHVDRPPTKISEIGARPAIAILPFFNQSDDSTREYFADGLTQDIINALGRFSELTVMSWNAVRPYKGKPSSPGEVGRNLGVRYQVEGSVRQTGDRVRVTQNSLIQMAAYFGQPASTRRLRTCLPCKTRSQLRLLGPWRSA